MFPVHKIRPLRSQGQPVAHYTTYKAALRADFNGSCGYCDDDDVYALGARGFHIDHFAPKAKFPHLRDSYDNLVYACPICNVYKGNYWPSEEAGIKVLDECGWEDPCDVAFDEHLRRLGDGRIVPASPLGEFMHRRLRLGLRRHQLIWLLAKTRDMILEITEEIGIVEEESETHAALLRSFVNLTVRFLEYQNELAQQ